LEREMNHQPSANSDEHEPLTCAMRLLGDGSIRGVAEIVESDGLLELHAQAAARAMGYEIAGEDRAASSRDPLAVRFVGLDTLDQCRRCSPMGTRVSSTREASHLPPRGEPQLTVGYVSGPAALLAAHAAHGCTDTVVALRAVNGRAAFVYIGGLPATPADEQHSDQKTGCIGALSPRQIDVLLLMLADLPAAATAARLSLSCATVRTHSRAVLREWGAADRRALRDRLLGATSGVAIPPVPAGAGARLPPGETGA
jgi:hypothetical protein